MSDVSGTAYDVYMAGANIRKPASLEEEYSSDEERVQEVSEKENDEASDDAASYGPASEDESEASRSEEGNVKDDEEDEEVDEEVEEEEDEKTVEDASSVGERPVDPPVSYTSQFAEFVKMAPPRKKTSVERQTEFIEKQSMLMDLARLKKNHKVELSKEWTMEDDFDEMSFELKRIMLILDENNNIAMMRNGLQIACTGIEMLSKRFKILDLDGWSAEACRDLGKHDRALGRMYRRYWRRSHSASPEADIALSLVGSMGMFHMKKVMAKRMFRPPPQKKSFKKTTIDYDDDEMPPP